MIIEINHPAILCPERYVDSVNNHFKRIGSLNYKITTIESLLSQNLDLLENTLDFIRKLQKFVMDANEEDYKEIVIVHQEDIFRAFVHMQCGINSKVFDRKPIETHHMILAGMIDNFKGPVFVIKEL